MKRYFLASVVFAVSAAGFAGAASADRYGLRRTCPQVIERGPMIFATCYNAFMGLVQSSIDTRACPAGISNNNGVLRCDAPSWGYGGPGFGPPPGPPPGWGGHRPRGPNWD